MLLGTYTPALGLQQGVDQIFFGLPSFISQIYSEGGTLPKYWLTGTSEYKCRNRQHLLAVTEMHETWTNETSDALNLFSVAWCKIKFFDPK